ncbi:MAG: single-stranded-DNA-specific exonuclease RecJ [Chloroflexi bacterium]|nr:single-stranded-DNA-specific exonuclease RecJ [Chloroflexota bacterium]
MTMRNSYIWHDPSGVEAAADLRSQVAGHPLVAQILAQRGCTTVAAAQAFLSPDNYPPAPPEALPDLVKSASYLSRAIQERQTILVWGDFDVDGQTATALLVDGLRRLGAQIAFYIPDRLRESHGIRLDSLEAQIEAVQPALLLTCDTGVSAHSSIDYAKSRGIITLITDHHDLPPELPHADAVVNPKRLPKDHALATLPGVGVAYKLIEYLYSQANRADEQGDFLDLVALGIVADVAVQTRDTRYLLQLGLDRLRATSRIGLQMLFETAQLSADRLTATDIGFQLGPRLNAAGRLASAAPVVELLTTNDPAQARMLALQLEGLNGQRRLLTRQIYAAAQEQIARDSSMLDWEALVLAHADWHAGIIGVVASQLADHYQRPVVLLSLDDKGRARGSARSAPGYDIGAGIAAQADLLLEHGGHPGAAGLSLIADNIPAFRRRLSDTLHATRDLSVRPGLHLDAYLSLGEINEDLTHELNRLAPFGEGNPPVLLATRDLTLKSAAVIGRSREHRRLTVEDTAGNRQQVFWWNSADLPLPDSLFDLAYHLDFSTYQGSTELQLTLADYRRAASAPVRIERPQRQITDLRRSPSPTAALEQLLRDYPDAAVWAEGYRRAESPGHPFGELSFSETLVVYTTPAGPYALHNALKQVQPTQLVLIGIDPPIQAFSDVQQRVLQLVKYVLNQQDGQTSLGALASAVGQLPETIRAALAYSAALGDISIEPMNEDEIKLIRVANPSAPDTAERLAALRACVAETAAYRAFFRRAAPEQILGEEGDE